jgi:hypothetical protein
MAADRLTREEHRLRSRSLVEKFLDEIIDSFQQAEQVDFARPVAALREAGNGDVALDIVEAESLVVELGDVRESPMNCVSGGSG